MTKDEPTIPVRPFLRIVANGRRRVKGGADRLKFTLIATPEFHEAEPFSAHEDGAFELRDWPSAMAERLRAGHAGEPFKGGGRLKLHARDILPAPIPAADGADSDWRTVELTAAAAKAFEDPARWSRITDLWQRALAGESMGDWQALAADIERSLSGTKRQQELSESYGGTAPTLDKNGALTSVPLDVKKPMIVKGVLPIRQSDLAIEEEGERAARVLAKQLLGPFVVLDDREEPVEGEYDEKFKAAAEGVDDERKRTKLMASAVSSLLAKGVDSNDKLTLQKKAEIIPRRGSVIAGRLTDDASTPSKEPSISDRDKRRATHKYGTWLQRGATPARNPDLPMTEAERQDKLRGVFFALQGDPTLARLFCLAVDFEVEEAAFTREAGGEKVHLAVAMPNPRTALIATAARRHTHGFWPVSAFEAHVVRTGNDSAPGYAILDRPEFVEQRDGIWKLGEKRKLVGEEKAAGGLVEVPRYDLISLDLRRSIDGKTTGRDRGEPHQTGGFTILDRGRADQIARDLALASRNDGNLGNPQAVIVLHAEELTVGRRVDVAAAAPGTELAKVAWRSLMHRYVDYGIGPEAKVVLKLLFPDYTAKGLLEEVSFQVAARSMPVVANKGEQACEAIAEEAIFLWDGTPAGVLTDSRLVPESKRSTEVNALPFSRAFDLPTAGPADSLCPAPLRFGCPYLFRLRSVFLGGGSPRHDDPDTAACTSAIAVLPATADTARPRRFLRHEGIRAPVLMLPKSLAEKRLAEMGYEQADQAIVRSWSAAPSGLDGISDTDTIRGAYVGGVTRAVPEQTTRILIAPEAALDLVVRHARLDRGDTVRIRRGALTDVSYMPRPAPDKGIAASGFPVVITGRRDTLDREGAIYRRKVEAAKDSNERGIPVFEPGGRNTTKPGEIGYLPDPAIDHYVIRARIRGSDRYLTSFIEAKVYGEAGYPDMLPLAVTVTRAGRAGAVRSEHPTSIAQIATLQDSAWMSEDGSIGAKKPSRGTRVRHLVVQLYPGEDFDLEIACLPESRMLSRCFSLPETMALQLKLAGKASAQRQRMVDICGASVAEACRPGSGTQQLAGLGGESVSDQARLDEVAGELLRAMQTKWPVEEVAAVTTLRVCHAVNKPPLLARWHGAEPIAAFRQPDTIPCDEVTEPRLADRLGATGLFLKGKVELDLALVDGFQILAETVAADGMPLDSAERGRSMISKRSGRWPRLRTRDGKEAYVAADDIVGFTVAENGAVTLPRQTVTLLDVGNLPTFNAVGEIVKRVLDSKTQACRLEDPLPSAFAAAGKNPGEPVFGATTGRLTAIELAPLFAAAGMSAPIAQRIAMEAGAEDATRRTRLLKTERPHSFKDTLARKLTLKLVSMSRQAAAFETAPAYFQGREQLLYRRQPLKRADQAVLSTEPVEVWMKSTRRPAVPDLRRPEPSFVITRSSPELSEADSKAYKLTRDAMTRLYFGRGWFSSGEGERVGIVLWPPNYNEQTESNIDKDVIHFDGRTLHLENFEDRDLGEGGAFITRWGGDPIRKDKIAQSGYFIPPRAFCDLKHQGEGPHRPGFVPTALMPIPRAMPPEKKDKQEAGSAEPAYDFLQVSLITYEPCFDLDREEWYVDIPLKPIRASEPFVRFGIVRYQEQSVSNDLQVSEPATVTMQLLPQREARIDIRKKAGSPDTTVEVTVEGLGSIGIKDLPVDLLTGSEREHTEWQANFETLQTPKMKLALFHEVEHGANGLVRSPIRVEAECLAFDAELSLYELPEPGFNNSTLIWQTEFTLPEETLRALGPGRVVAYIEEVDRRMPAAYRSEPITPRAMFETKSYVESGPRFSARIPFLERA